MKKLIFSFFLCGATMFPAFSQTYQELSERAVAATEQDSLSLAEKYIEQALKMEPANPHNALLFSNLGTIQRRQHRYEQALDSYTLALNIAPRAIPALMNRAALYLELGKDDLARIDYSLVLDIESDNQEALLMRAYIYMRQRNYNFAKSDYERLLKLAPQSYNGRLGLATLEQKEGKYEALGEGSFNWKENGKQGNHLNEASSLMASSKSIMARSTCFISCSTPARAT